MTKYRAVKAISPNVKVGDIVETDEELIPEYKNSLVPVTDDGEDREITTNPDRDELKARATELGLDFANNIPTEKLIELIKEAEAENGSEDE